MRSCFQYLPILILFTVLINACNAPPTLPPLPTPQPLTVLYTPALRPILNAVNACALQQPEIALLVKEVSANFQDTIDADLSLRIGLPKNSTAFSAPITFDEILLIVHPTNPVETLSYGEIVSIFTGVISNWTKVNGDDSEIAVWINYSDDDTHQIFQDGILQTLSPTTLSNLAPDPEAMLTAVGNNPTAIGYLPRSWLSPSVKTIEIPSEVREKLIQPVLALASGEPQGESRVFLFCLQSGKGQEIIHDIYIEE
ncbi:MAG: substrate-binding domain-containing protein [Anaerolineales bacterium]|nr:substrate-binding domain-containing protein [Anaerolineales bacterium]